MLDVCPVSNLRDRRRGLARRATRCPRWSRRASACSVSTDDPAMFGTDLDLPSTRSSSSSGSSPEDCYRRGRRRARCATRPPARRSETIGREHGVVPGSARAGRVIVTAGRHRPPRPRRRRAVRRPWSPSSAAASPGWPPRSAARRRRCRDRAGGLAAAGRQAGRLRRSAASRSTPAPRPCWPGGPEGVGLIAELGLAGELRQPGTTSAGIWTRGEVRPLPRRQFMGVPADFDELAAHRPAVARRAGPGPARTPTLPADPRPTPGTSR